MEPRPSRLRLGVEDGRSTSAHLHGQCLWSRVAFTDRNSKLHPYAKELFLSQPDFLQLPGCILPSCGKGWSTSAELVTAWLHP